MPNYVPILIAAGAAVVVLLVLGLVMARLYNRTTREMSLVRTGAGGRKIVVDGGCLVLPMFHMLTRINMKTLRLEVKRMNEASLITKDRMRVDVGVEFYVRVQSTEDGIARAAQTLGEKTFQIDALKEMIEGKLVDGLRAVAAQMTMDELHEQRANFVQQVQQAVSEDLVKNGLELESVSLTMLDQTPFDRLDDNNAFNAAGMRKLVEVTSAERKRRAEVEAETDLDIKRTKQRAAIEGFEVEKAEESARVANAIALAEMRSREKTAHAQQSELAARAADEARIERERAIEEAGIAKNQAIDIAEQNCRIAISEKSKEESLARAEADKARAEAAVAEEAVVTARQLAEADRAKKITITKAQEEAEKAATAIRVQAAAEREAAADRAAAMRETAEAEGDQIKILAKAELERATAEAEGRAALVAAENNISAEIIAMKVTMHRLDQLPAIIQAMVAPAEKIDSITVHQVSGLNGAAVGGSAGEGATAAGPIDQIGKVLADMTVQMPVLKAIGEAAGLTLGKGINGVLEGEVAALGDAATAPAAPAQPEVKPNGAAAHH